MHYRYPRFIAKPSVQREMVTLSSLLLFVAAIAAVYGQSCENPDAQVLILGAGMSGISAARTLYENGVTDFIILEQANRVGGRMRSTELAGTVIDIGPQWLFTTLDPTDESNPTNILYQFAQECGLELRPGGLGTRGTITYDRNGVDVSPFLFPAFGRYAAAEAAALELGARLDEEDPEGTTDFSVEVGLRLSGWTPRGPVDQLVEYINFDFPVTQTTSFVSFRRRFGRDRRTFPIIHLVTDQRGYAYLAECIGQAFLDSYHLHLNTTVSAIQYSDECVCATAQENGVTRQYCAPYAIHTFALGTLQFGTIQFEPPLPESKVFAFNLQHPSVFQKVWIVFNETFWDTDVDFIFILDPVFGREYFPVFQPIGASYPGNPPILEALLSGETSLRVGLQDPEISRLQLLEILGRIYGDRVTEPVDILQHDYATNPYFYGNLETSTVGVTRQTFAEYAAPLGRLYFSGAGTHVQNTSNLQGAYYSGIDTANAILEDIQQDLILGAEFINDTPRVVGDSVEAEFVTTGGPFIAVICRLRQPGVGFIDIEECSSGTVQFTGLDPGIYTLMVIVRDTNRDRAVERASFVIPDPDED